MREKRFSYKKQLSIYFAAPVWCSKIAQTGLFEFLFGFVFSTQIKLGKDDGGKAELKLTQNRREGGGGNHHGMNKNDKAPGHSLSLGLAQCLGPSRLKAPSGGWGGAVAWIDGERADRESPY